MRKTRSKAFSWSGPCFAPADYALAFFTALGALIVYLLTLGPTITGEDSGELVTAAWSLGIPHPPGYPVWCLLGHLFTQLPWGSVAWRVNLLSAVCGAGTVFLTALLIIHLTRNRWAALAGALAFGYSWEFWEQSVIAEVYTLNALFIAACVFLLWRWHASGRDRWLYGFALAYGVSLGNHNTMMVLGPVFALFILGVDLPHIRWKTYAGLLAVASLGGLVYLYLPMRSSANPVMDWGNPETFQNFIDHVRRKQYLFMMTENPRSLARFLRQLQVMGTFWIQQFTPVISLLGAAGLLVLLWRRAGYGVFLLLLGSVAVITFVLAQNFDFDKQWLCVMSVFGLPAYWVTALGLGVAIDALTTIWPKRLWAAVLAGLCVIMPLAANWHDNDKSHYYWTCDYARNVLHSLDDNAIYIPAVDHQSFSAIYMQAVEQIRPDITIGRKYGYVDMSRVPEMPKEIRKEIGEFPRRREEPRIFTWLLHHTDRPVYFNEPPELPEESGIQFVQRGLVYQAVRAEETLPARDYWDEYRWHTLSERDIRGDNTAELIFAEVNMAQGKDYIAQGKEDDGLRLLYRATEIYGPDAALLNNAGTICARAGLYYNAHGFFAQALQADPHCETARRNLERVDALMREYGSYNRVQK
ncbi:MAG TPA: DUF2723 domain-containing protein [Candidatus Hydrogenedentes bacterium]|nr:DUF2723 domain-containing protein [Candidatus Hydrogenedentota bacterium]